MSTQFKILSPTAILGYGYPLDSFMKGIEEKPDLIAVDAGSVDPGPYYLGAGKAFTDRTGVKRDLRYILKEAFEHKIPVAIGTAGGSGAKPHVEWCRQIINEIVKEEALHFNMAVIHADIPKKRIIQALKNNQTEPLAGLPPLDLPTIAGSRHIVAQMGIEPFINAFQAGANLVVAGRAYDPSVFAALPISMGFDPGLAMHMGKILECAAIAADPGSGSDCALGILKENSFVLKALNPKRRFTEVSSAAHTLYEKSNPSSLPGPGGLIDLKNVAFKAGKDGSCEVSGSEFVPSDKYMVKLEGSAIIGYRTVSIAGTRDPIMISSIDTILDKVNAQVTDILKEENITGQIQFHVYGKDAVMGQLEPELNTINSKELGIVIDVLADTQKKANSICSITRSSLLHYGYKGRISTAGNLAFPFSPSDLPAGEVYKFSIYHLMEVDDGNELFPIEFIEL